MQVHRSRRSSGPSVPHVHQESNIYFENKTHLSVTSRRKYLSSMNFNAFLPAFFQRIHTKRDWSQRSRVFSGPVSQTLDRCCKVLPNNQGPFSLLFLAFPIFTISTPLLPLHCYRLAFQDMICPFLLPCSSLYNHRLTFRVPSMAHNLVSAFFSFPLTSYPAMDILRIMVKCYDHQACQQEEAQVFR